jgi:hypothetical protein
VRNKRVLPPVPAVPVTAVDHIRVYIKQHFKNQTAAAKAWGIGVSHMSAILHGYHGIPPQILEAIGWEWRLVPKEKK